MPKQPGTKTILMVHSERLTNGVRENIKDRSKQGIHRANEVHQVGGRKGNLEHEGHEKVFHQIKHLRKMLGRTLEAQVASYDQELTRTKH
jgi:hypothetical protein